MNDVTKPNFMRYQRVADLINGEAALKERLGSKTEAVLKPNGEKVEFAKEIVDLTERIHAAGHDAHTLNKQQILKYAVAVILWDGDGGLPPVPPRSEAPATPSAAPEPKKRAPAKAKKPRKRKEVEKKPAVPAEEKTAAVPTPLAPAPVTPVAKPKPAAPAGVRQVTVSSPPAQCAGTNYPFAVGCAANSCLMAAVQLMEIHDPSAEGKEIVARLNKIIEDVMKRTIIPNSSQVRV